MKTNSLGFIGGGRITRIFLQALSNVNVEFESIIVFDTNKEIIEKLKQNFPKIRQAETAQETAKQSIVFIALHPPIIMEMLEHLKEVITKDSIVISLAPKITIDKMACLTLALALDQ
jgi:pyrroline-5-carboxylate reductase